MDINFSDKLNLIRQQLRTAKTLSGQAKESLKKVESGSENASSLLGSVSKDVFEAGLSNQRWALKGAGQRAEETLGQVQVQHGQVASDFDLVLDADPGIGDALDNAKAATETLGLSTSDTWLLRNAIDSGQREAGYASQSTDEIDKSLWGIEGQLDGVVDSAHELGTPPRWGNGNGNGGGHGNGHWGRGRRRHHSEGHGSWGSGGGAGASRFRERLQARIAERRNRAHDIDETASKLDNPFDDIDRAADRGARHLVDVAGYVDQALHWVDDLEMKFSKSNQPAKPKVVAKPTTVSKPASQPSPLSPIPVFDTPAPKAPEPKPEGFFKKPWRSGS